MSDAVIRKTSHMHKTSDKLLSVEWLCIKNVKIVSNSGDVWFVNLDQNGRKYIK